MVALDLYIAYLRAAFHTCYYCAVVTDHLEELQRKCVKHVRKPWSNDHKESRISDTLAAEDNADGDTQGKEDDGKERPLAREKQSESKDARKNGAYGFTLVADNYRELSSDERWLDWLDSKLALLLERNAVDPRAYGGKHPDE